MNFDQAFEKLLGHEGGYVNNPADPGGETKYGISKRAYPTLDIKNLTLDTAKTIYLVDYWRASGCDAAPDKIKFQIFDVAVNSGVGRAVQFVQSVVGATPDGIMGPKTLAALAAIDPPVFISHFNAERLEFMAHLPEWPSFGRGWARRIANNLREA